MLKLVLFSLFLFYFFYHVSLHRKKSFLNRYQQFGELVDILTHQVTQVHNNLLSNILYDAESYHWAEEKEFYEVSWVSLFEFSHFSSKHSFFKIFTPVQILHCFLQNKK